MEVDSERAMGRKDNSLRRQRKIKFWFTVLLALTMGLGSAYYGWALQRHEIAPGTGQTDTSPVAPIAAPGHGPAETQPPQPQTPSQTPPTTPPHAANPSAPAGVGGVHAPQLPPAAHAPLPAVPAAGGGHEPAGGHGESAEGHGPALPQLSPTPGVTFVETMIALLDHELHGRTLGWRPNDIVVGRFTDNINNYQLGVLEALRFTTLRLKHRLTRMGDADTYDPDLEKALHLLMNSATLFWFPSSESVYEQSIEHLKAFLEKLKTGKRSFYYRKDNLVALIANYKDLLGNVNRSLVAPNVSWFMSDDYFYYAKGVAHVYYEILRVVRVGFQPQLTSTLYGLDIMDTMLHELQIAEGIEPWIILDSGLGGFFANHRANLNAPLSEVAHLMVVMSQL
jgi:hypothetical protein